MRTLAVTYNAPGRYGLANMSSDVQRYADRPHVGVICVNEVADAAVAQMCPNGWRRHRPKKERSSAIFWDPKPWLVRSRGAFQVHSDGWRTPRYIVWVLLENRETGELVRFGAIHLLAFKTSSTKSGHEFRHQATRVAEWLARPGHRATLGDLNAEAGSVWLVPIDKVANPHTPAVKSGPEGQPIDLVYVDKDHPRAVKAKALPGHSDHNAVEVEILLKN